MDTIKFLDGFSVSVGQRVTLHSRYGTRGAGTVLGIKGDNVRVQMDEGTEFGALDRYPLKTGGIYDAIATAGVSGGCICRPGERP